MFGSLVSVAWFLGGNGVYMLPGREFRVLVGVVEGVLSKICV